MASECKFCGHPSFAADVIGCGAGITLGVLILVMVVASHGMGYDKGFEAAKVKYSRWF